VEAGEPISPPDFEKSLVKNDEPCKKPASAKKPSWQARVNVHGALKDCSGTRLYKSMHSLFKGKKKFGFLSGPVPYIEKKPEKWRVELVKPDAFPIQAHHLIPKNHLPTHPVCTFLAEKYNKNPKYKLTADSPYDTDHANNGYCLPYATPMAEWKEASGNDSLKLEICFLVMKQSRRQLHQGSHRARPYEEDTADPDEENKIHPKGYLNSVNRYLTAVLNAGQKHADTCKVCKEKKDKKEVNPREQTVVHMDQAAGIIKLLVDANRIFISEPAFLYLKPTKVEAPSWLK
jgi:hypothetical protein